MNLQNARNLLQQFDFTRLFIEELGWSKPSSSKTVPMAVKDLTCTRREVAQLSGVVVIEILTDAGPIPDAAGRAAIHKEIAKLHHENVLIFVDAVKSHGNKPSQCVLYWAKRQDKKVVPRSHIFVHGQSGDLLLSKLAALAVDFADFDDSGHIPLMEVTNRLKQALDIERVTKKFYVEFQKQHEDFLELIEGIDDERDRRWYASVLLNRLMFIYFLQKKFFLDGGDELYLQNKLRTYSSFILPPSSFYSSFLKALFFEGFANPEEKRSAETNALLGKIKYLNGGLFLPHPIELRWPKIAVPDQAFENLFALFGRYSWNLNDTPKGDDNEINPDVLGYIFEKYINQKAFGAYYTRPEITEYLCERTIHRLILDGVNSVDAASRRATFDSMGDLLLNLDAPLCKRLLQDVLPSLRLLDPACGSAAFLVSAMKTLINVYAAVIGKIEFLNSRELQEWLKKTQKEHKSVAYFIKRSIITNNLFGVDIMEEAVEIAKLRLFLALVASAQTADELEPLPNIEFNIMPGNSLIGLLHVDPAKFDALTNTAAEQKRMIFVHEPSADELGFVVESAPGKTRKEKEREYLARIHGQRFNELLKEKNDLIELYRRATGFGHDLQELRDGIEKKKNAAKTMLNRLLLEQFQSLDIRYEQATWDAKKNKEGKPERRALTVLDIEALKPFHWGYEFDQILAKGGFDAIITNPPWEIFKPNAKEFFEDFSELVTKKKMTIKEFEKEQAGLLKDADIRAAWLKYQSEYPHVSAFYRSAPQYQNQISIVDGKKAGSDTNLYKLFVEQCYNLLRPNGYCGIVIPSGIYTDLGTKQLREMLFGQTLVTGLFCFENRKEIFEGVDSRFKFVVLSYEKGGSTDRFPAAFMRHDVAELERFPREGAIDISIELVRRLSPDSLSVMEFKTPLDVQIAQRMLKFPLLGERMEGMWNVSFTAEFHMTNDSGIFKTEPAKGRLPLYEGKMIHQFRHGYANPRYWIMEKEGRTALLKRGEEDNGQTMAYQSYRLGFRDIARNTDERTMICGMLPMNVFAGNTLITTTSPTDNPQLVAIAGLFDSMAFDFFIRQKVTAHCNMFAVYQVPVPRLTEKDTAFRPIVERAARLICTTPEFDDLAKEIFGGKATARSVGVTEPADRMRLRAELDAMVAQLYGLTEEEFAYILTTFPLVDESVKQLTLNTYRDLQRLGKLPDTRL